MSSGRTAANSGVPQRSSGKMKARLRVLSLQLPGVRLENEFLVHGVSQGTSQASVRAPSERCGDMTKLGAGPFSIVVITTYTTVGERVGQGFKPLRTRIRPLIWQRATSPRPPSWNL